MWRRALGVWKRYNKGLNRLEELHRREKLISLPYRLSLETTLRCNLRCPMCFRSHVKDTPEEINRLAEMPMGLFHDIAGQLFPTARTVNITLGGEPFMVKALDTILDVAEHFDVKLDIVTNGVLLNRDGLLLRLLPLLDCIEVSIDSTVPEQFERIRFPAKFERVIANTEELARLRMETPEPRFRFGVSFDLMRENAQELSKVVRLVSELGGTHVRVTPLLVYEEQDREKSVLMDPDLHNRVLNEALATAAETGVELHAPGAIQPEQEAGVPPMGECHDVYNNTFINFEGYVRTCCQYNPPSAGKMPEQRFSQIWNNSFMRTMRRTYDTPDAHPSCRHCFIVNRGPNTVENRMQQEFYFLWWKPGKGPAEGEDLRGGSQAGS